MRSKHASPAKPTNGGSRLGANAKRRGGTALANERARRAPATTGTSRLFTFEVFLISGPISPKFAQRNKTVSRTVQILGAQTLKQLHEAIFDAFDREEEHLYEFQLGGSGPMDPKARRYGLTQPADFGPDEAPADVSKTAVGSLGLKIGDTFGYWFDFGDDWWHQLNVTAIESTVPPGHYPRVVQRVGQSPPQYPDT